MKRYIYFLIIGLLSLSLGCTGPQENQHGKNAAEILGNSEYLAFSYGGYRHKTREQVPSIEEIKDDMRILEAMGVKIIRTYNTQQFAQAANLLEAIHQLKSEKPAFEMYVMLGAWIDCKGAWTGTPLHDMESVENNTLEINAAVELAKKYPEIVKIIAVGNEAMVHWAWSYFVSPKIITKWVQHLQDLKESKELPSDLWITSSDNFASWGGSQEYQSDDLAELINAVDYVSLHTYPFHDSHYTPAYWLIPAEEENLPELEQVNLAMLRAKEYAITQYQSAADYIHSIDPKKEIHIGETGWASKASTNYGVTGSRAADEYKVKLYFDHMRDWTNKAGMSCFYFEAFDEQWKDANDSLGSENNFGLINLQGEAKYALWDLVDAGAFKDCSRNGKPITKSYGGSESALMEDLLTLKPTIIE